MKGLLFRDYSIHDYIGMVPCNMSLIWRGGLWAIVLRVAMVGLVWCGGGVG